MKNTSLKEITFLFLKLGIIGFGGPAAHISMMRQEVVTKKSGCLNSSSWTCLESQI